MSEQYLSWIREQPCVSCGMEAEPHHIKIKGLHLGGMGMKAPHLFVIPLCRRHHDALHRNVQEWETIHGSQYFWLVRTLQSAIRDGKVDY